MKDPIEVLRFKEQELVRVRREIDALRVAARLMEETVATPGMSPKTNGTQKMELP